MRVRVCRKESGQAINAFAFRLVAGGREYEPDALASDFDVNREGCETGRIVFQGPGDGPASELRFRYDDTGTGGPSPEREEHVDFTWAL